MAEGRGAAQAPVELSAAERESVQASLSQGTATVLGLVVPQGMVPDRAPPKVYRFVGQYPVAHLAEAVRSQVKAKQEVGEGAGVLFRSATVKQPAGRATGKERLAIRVRPTENGAQLDVWEETLPVKPGAGSGSASARYDRAAPEGVPMQGDAARAYGKEVADMVRAARKIQRGEPLTEQDKKTPLVSGD